MEYISIKTFTYILSTFFSARIEDDDNDYDNHDVRRLAGLPSTRSSRRLNTILQKHLASF